MLPDRRRAAMEESVHKHHTCCVPDRTIMEHCFVVLDMIETCLNLDPGPVSIDGGTAFARVGRVFKTLKACGCAEKCVS